MEYDEATDLLRNDATSMESDSCGAMPQEQKVRLPGQRGRQKRPTKILVTMRFSPEILDYFKATGEGWQTRINAVLCEYVSHHNDVNQEKTIQQKQ
jgi:uncharacterized protein (DUF4415 family)